jgi:DMSO/TMAO reductase YedYZ molybdopterin-dependent catalytic subunit
MGTAPEPHRSVFSRTPGIIGLIILASLTAGVLLVACTPKKQAAARPAPLHVTGQDPTEHIKDAEAYRLRIWGKVGKEVSLSLADIKAMPSVETDAPLKCVVGWTDHAIWRGVAIRDVVKLAEPKGDAFYLVFHDDRSFSATLDTDYVRTGKPILAYDVNGAPLPQEHGWPLRVVAPDKYGFKWVKWLTSIELTDRGFEGTYESSGWSLNGNVNEPPTEAEKHKQ